MANSEQPADSWEDLDKLALDKLSLGDNKAKHPVAERKGSVTSSHEERLDENHEVDTLAAAQNNVHTSTPQPIIDPAVRDALINPLYRIQVLRFEADVEKFVRQGGQQDLTFDATLTGYQRLLCHRVAQYYGLDTSTIDEGEDQGKILARRTAVTAIPGVQLADVKLAADSRDQRRVETPPRVLMKTRAAADRAARAAAAAANGEAAGHANSRTVQEREQDYSKARARIFGVQPNSDPGMSPSHSPQMHDNAMRGMMNGSRPPNVGPLGGRGRGPPGRVDQGKKAVFRNREQDLQDPDYRRSVYSYRRFDPGYGDMSGMQQTMYIRPTYSSEFPELPGGMANHSLQGPFSPGSVPHSPAGPPGLVMAGPMPHPEYMHPAMGAGGQYMPVPMQFQMVQGMPYAMMGPGCTPMSALSPGMAMPGAMHPMHNMPAMYPAAPMAFPGMPMAPPPYGFMAPGQEGIPMQMGSPTMYGAFPPHQVMPFAMPAMSLEQQMQQQQQHQPQMGSHARAWPSNNNFNRRSSGQQGARSQNTSRPASAAPSAAVNKSAQQEPNSKPFTGVAGTELGQQSSAGVASSGLSATASVIS
ncbi:hypothetical protein ABBQ32_003649 [Trebouxia sp. C0010 RCD-2024]